MSFQPALPRRPPRAARVRVTLPGRGGSPSGAVGAASHRVLPAAWRSGEMGSMVGPDLGSGLGTPPGLPRCGQAA